MMILDEKKQLQLEKNQEDFDDEEEMRKASLKNPPDPCGREEDRFGK